MWTDLLLGSAALWHTAAAFYFLFRAGPMLGSHAFERPVNAVAMDMMQFLGAMNIAIIVACVYGLLGGDAVRTPVLLIVAVANLSQFAKDVHAHRTGRWKPRLGAITSIDGFFGVGCLGAYFQSLAQA